MSFSESLQRCVHHANRFTFPGSSKRWCQQFIIDKKPVGLVRPDVLEYMKDYPNVFHIKKNHITEDIEHIELNPDLSSFDDRTETVAAVLKDWREKEVFETLDGWRNECYDVVWRPSEPALMKMERAATCLFGLKQFGVHINGYVNDPNQGLSMWIAKRSMDKPTFPGKLDQMVAGGLASGQSVMDCAIKECKEEASISQEITKNLKPAGCVSYYYEDERGLFPEMQYVMDLEVDASFTPKNSDGEVDSFQLMTIQEVKDAIVADKFKFNCSVVVIDFMIRHGIITPGDEPNYGALVQSIHSTLP